MEFVLNTPDLRVHAGGDGTADGTDFEFKGLSQFVANRGTYHFSLYGHLPYGGFSQADGFGPMVHMTLTEMQLIKAEGLLQTGNTTAAAAIVNATRVVPGGLPAVTGSDADLMDKLIYEKRIETFLLCSGCAFFDRRGFGPLAPTGPAHHQGLVEGTPIHFPIPGSELARLGIPSYTFGGVGMEMGPAVAAAAGSIGPAVPASAIYRFRPGMTTSEKITHLRMDPAQAPRIIR